MAGPNVEGHGQEPRAVLSRLGHPCQYACAHSIAKLALDAARVRVEAVAGGLIRMPSLTLMRVDFRNIARTCSPRAGSTGSTPDFARREELFTPCVIFGAASV